VTGVGKQSLGEPDAIYQYRDEQGTLMFEVVRFPGKEFRQRRPDTTAPGGWSWRVRGVRRVLYRLPELVAAVDRGEVVYVCEGERDVDAIVAAGGVATCNPGGAGKWRKDFASFFEGADVVVVADDDPPGIKHAQAVRAALLGVASTARIMVAAEGKDAADHLAAGKSLDEFVPHAPANRRDEDLSDLTVDDILDTQPEMSRSELLAANPTLKSLLGGRGSAATVLVDLAHDARVGLFRTPDQKAYACIDVSGHEETRPVRSRAFGLYLRRLYHREQEAAPSQEAVAAAIATLESEALFDGVCLPVYTRVAGAGGAIYLDLCDPEWRVVEVTADGWSLRPAPPVRFHRAPSMAALPEPVHGGSVDELRAFVNVADDEDWHLLVGWLVGALRPAGPYPVLGLHGEQGSAKTTMARVLGELVDPSTVPVRAGPRDERDLMIAATNRWLVNLDNLSRIPAWLSDAICRLATGGGFTTRELYTDADEVLFDAMRPVIINGIEELATRSDLLDRAILLNLPTIEPDRRRPEKEYWHAFERARPRILGGPLDALSCALRHVDETHLAQLPRMADFALWATAAEPALSTQHGSFLAAYTGNRAQAHELAVDATPFGQTLLEVARDGFEGTASELLERLVDGAGEQASRQREWPRNPRALSAALKRLAPNLRALGCPVEFTREPTRDRRRIIRLGPTCVRTVQPAQMQGDEQPESDAPGLNLDRSDETGPSPSPQPHRGSAASDDLDANLNQLLQRASERASDLGYPGFSISPGRSLPSGPGPLTAFLRGIEQQGHGDPSAIRDLRAALDALSRIGDQGTTQP
jgi:hypothetical protein